MTRIDEKQIQLLTEVLPHVARQMRPALANIHTALHSLIPPEQRDGDARTDRNAAILMQSYYRLLRTVNNLQAAPMLVGEELFTCRDVEIVEWLDNLCRQTQPLAELAGVTLEWNCSLRAHHVAVHPGYLERLVWNLLSNAMKFTPAGGKVTVSLHLSGRQLVLTVSDTGCGIPEARMGEVFERYLHTDLTDPLPHGLGLGLPLARRIAQGHGGRLLLQSAEGAGTTVTVSLPDRRAEGAAVEDFSIPYAGGFSPVLMELSDALSYRAFLQKYTD